MHTVHEACTVADEAPYDSGEVGNGEIPEKRAADFVRTVPIAQSGDDAGEHTSLEHTDDESESKDLRFCVDGAAARGDYSPSEEYAGLPRVRCHVFEDKVAGEFENDVGNMLLMLACKRQ